MVFGCLRRCALNGSEDDLTPYEKAHPAQREVAREERERVSISPPAGLAPPRDEEESPQLLMELPRARKITLALDHNDSFVPLLCSTKMAGATGHHRSISLLGGEGSFHDMVLTDRCRSLSNLVDGLAATERETTPDGRLLRHDHYSTEKFISTTTLVDPSKITEDRTRQSPNKEEVEKEEAATPAAAVVSEEKEQQQPPLEPAIRVIRGPLPMIVSEPETATIPNLVSQLVSTVARGEESPAKEATDRAAISGLMEELLKKLGEIKESEMDIESDWRETPLLNHSLSPIVEESNWKIYEDEREEEGEGRHTKAIPISSTPRTRYPTKLPTSIKLKIREEDPPLPPPPSYVMMAPITPEAATSKDYEQEEEQMLRAPRGPKPVSRFGVSILSGSQVHFTAREEE